MMDNERDRHTMRPDTYIRLVWCLVIAVWLIWLVTRGM
jgi:hypothetical protein